MQFVVMRLVLSLLFTGLAALILAPLTMPIWVFSGVLYGFSPAYRGLWNWCTGITLCQCLLMIYGGAIWPGLESLVRPGIVLTLLTGAAWLVGHKDIVPIYQRAVSILLQCCVAGAAVGFTVYKLASG